jgi:hypothetical protein
MVLTPVYAETVRATGIVPEGDPTAATEPHGTMVVELPSMAPGVIYQATSIRVAPLPHRTFSVIQRPWVGEPPALTPYRFGSSSLPAVRD